MDGREITSRWAELLERSVRCALCSWPLHSDTLVRRSRLKIVTCDRMLVRQPDTLVLRERNQRRNSRCGLLVSAFLAASKYAGASARSSLARIAVRAPCEATRCAGVPGTSNSASPAVSPTQRSAFATTIEVVCFVVFLCTLTYHSFRSIKLKFMTRSCRYCPSDADEPYSFQICAVQPRP